MWFFKPRFRIVTDKWAGYEAQKKVWWSPFWTQLDGVNTHSTIESAVSLIKKHKIRVVMELE